MNIILKYLEKQSAKRLESKAEKQQIKLHKKHHKIHVIPIVKDLIENNQYKSGTHLKQESLKEIINYKIKI